MTERVERNARYLGCFDERHERMMVEILHADRATGFRGDAARSELVRRLNEIGCEIPQESIRKRPNISWTLLNDADEMRKFIEIQDWVVAAASGAVAPA